MSINNKGVLKIWKILEDYHLLYQLHAFAILRDRLTSVESTRVKNNNILR